MEKFIQKLKEIFDKIPKWLWVSIAIIGILLVARKMLKRLFGSMNPLCWFGLCRDEEDEQNSKLKNDSITYDKEKLSRDTTYYRSIANNLYTYLTTGTQQQINNLDTYLRSYNKDELKAIWKLFDIKSGMNLGDWFVSKIQRLEINPTLGYPTSTDSPLGRMRELWRTKGTGISF